MSIRVNGRDVEIRRATDADVPVLLTFIRAMGAFEHLTVTATEESLRASLLGEDPAAHALLIVVDGTPAGYVTYYYTFASMQGMRALWLDDLYLDADYRNLGIGQAVMAYLADLAVRRGCGRFEWIVIDSNTNAIAMYRKLGATIYTNWHICRLTGDALARVAASHSPPNPDVGLGPES